MRGGGNLFSIFYMFSSLCFFKYLIYSFLMSSKSNFCTDLMFLLEDWFSFSLVPSYDLDLLGISLFILNFLGLFTYSSITIGLIISFLIKSLNSLLIIPNILFLLFTIYILTYYYWFCILGKSEPDCRNLLFLNFIIFYCCFNSSFFIRIYFFKCFYWLFISRL